MTPLKRPMKILLINAMSRSVEFSLNEIFGV